MPLDDREQRILEEIERQFYEDDPKLAETVRTANLASASGRHLKWAALGLLGGVALMLVFFTSQTLVALAGFVLMVLSVAWIIAIVRHRSGVASGHPWVEGLRHRRWRSR
jgi:hypothetical protein